MPKYPPAPPHRAAIPSLVAARLHGANTRSAVSAGPSRATNREKKMQHEMNIQRRGGRGRTAEPLTDCRARGGGAAAAARCFQWLGRRRSAAGSDSYRRNPSKRGGFEGGEGASAGRGMGGRRLTSVASLRRVTEADVARTWLHWRAGGADVAASGLGHVGRGGDGATGEVGLLRSALQVVRHHQ